MPYRAAILGAGGVAGMGIYGGDEDDIGADPVDASHAGGYAAVDDVELVAIADIDPNALDRFGHAWEVPEEGRYTDYEAMFAAEDLDILSVCTPAIFHREHVVDAAEQSDVEAIWCEKPVACSVSGAEEMVKACEDADVELVINHSQRFYRQNQAVKAAIERGLVGDVQSVTIGSSMELLRVGTHIVDLVVYLLDARAETVAGYVTGENQAAVDLTDRQVDDAGAGGFFVTDDGTFVSFDGTASREVGTFHCRLNGTEGRLVDAEDSWRYWEGTGERDGHIEREPPTEGYTDDHKRAFVTAVEHVVDLIEGRATNVSPGWQACHTLEILVGLYASDTTGGRASVPLDRPLRDVTVTSW